MSHRLRTTSLATLAAGVVTAAVMAAPSPAQALQSSSVQLLPGQSVCVSQYAGFQVRLEGSSKKPLRYRVLRNGVALQAQNGVTAFAAEYRSAFGTFPGPGTYQICAVNNTTVASLVTVTLRSDGEFF